MRWDELHPEALLHDQLRELIPTWGLVESLAPDPRCAAHEVVLWGEVPHQTRIVHLQLRLRPLMVLIQGSLCASVRGKPIKYRLLIVVDYYSALVPRAAHLVGVECGEHFIDTRFLMERSGTSAFAAGILAPPVDLPRSAGTGIAIDVMPNPFCDCVILLALKKERTLLGCCGYTRDY
jgi:hypothetical protein